ncbi:MAG: ABC transporter permease [Actinobacteria bacterium]|nr:MAG: ABC transporter permease [Actinomycetota bacterium]
MTAIAARMRFARTGSGRVGVTATLLLLALILIGPLVAPHDPAAIVGIPLQRPGSGFLLGTDGLGRDVLSRVLWGGRSIIALSVVATGLAYLVGLAIGLVAGYTRSLLDPVLMRAMDVLLAVPPLLFLLVLATGAGHSVVVLVLGVATVHVPSIARIVRAATQSVVVRGYVEAAVARGERTHSILAREILPNVLGTVLADAGIRLTGSILILASVNFLGLGLQPPRADWALMISENRGGITLQPWAVAAPALLIAFLTVAVNLVADAIARSLGTSLDRRRIAR